MSRQTEQRHERELTERKADRQVGKESSGVEMDSQKEHGHRLTVRYDEDFSKSKDKYKKDLRPCRCKSFIITIPQSCPS